MVEALLGPPKPQWLVVGPPVGPTDPPGSLVSVTPAGREVYLFGWLDPDGRAGLWRSRAGVDLEDPQVRMVASVGGLVQEADLELLDEPVELKIWRGGVALTVRFRVEAEP